MVNRIRFFLSLGLICTVSIGILYFFGIRIPYLNLHLGKTMFFLGIAGIVFFAIAHPLWKRVVFCISVLGLLTFSWFQLRFEQVWILPILISFPYASLLSLLINRQKYFVAVGRLYERRYIVLLVLLTSLMVILSYSQTPSLYFEGDEWYRFRTYIPVLRTHSALTAGMYHTLTSPAEYGFHQSFVVNALYPILFTVFGTYAFPYLILSLILHTLTSSTAGYFAYLLSGNKRVGIATSLGFAVLASHSQAVTWIDAVLNTQLAVLFGLCALISILFYVRNGERQWLYLNAFLLLLALWSKETALTFVFATIFLYVFEKKKPQIQDGISLSVSLGVFAIARILPSFFSSNKSSLELFAVLANEKERGLFIFRLWLFPIKIFSQIFIPQEKLIEISIWLTDMQYPFFAMEKAIGGSTYANFIQTIVPEMISIIFSIIFFFLFYLWTKKDYQRVWLVTFLSFVLGCVPIVLITLMFPWWGTVSLIDSRHLYHLSIFALLLGALTLDRISSTYFLRRRSIMFFGLLLFFLVFQFLALQQKIGKQLQTGRDRRLITDRIISAVGRPKDRIVIYTTSNKSYYGFAEFMLPFQTSFAHMLPILFSHELNKNGIEYPDSFYGKDFFSAGGLVAQGFEEKDGKAIGYFLDQKLLQRAVIDHHIKPRDIYAFRFDGDKHALEDVSGAMHERMENFIRSREKFAQWRPVEYMTDRVRFLVHPSWVVNKQGNTIHITNADGEGIFELTIHEPNGRTHSQFSLEYGIANQLRMRNRDYDFDTERLEYYFADPKDNRLFLMAGNNMKFYILKYTQQTLLDDFLRSFEFEDDIESTFLLKRESL